jgi:hypothetical protein
VAGEGKLGHDVLEVGSWAAMKHPSIKLTLLKCDDFTSV